MNYYIDIFILSDPEFSATVLLNALYTKLHKTLCDLSSINIGVSFPKYKVTLGNVLRIHGEKSVLHNLQSINWIGGMKGYCDVSEIMLVPKNSKFRTASRKQTTMSQAKLRRIINVSLYQKKKLKDTKKKCFLKN